MGACIAADLVPAASRIPIASAYLMLEKRIESEVIQIIRPLCPVRFLLTRHYGRGKGTRHAKLTAVMQYLYSFKKICMRIVSGWLGLGSLAEYVRIWTHSLFKRQLKGVDLLHGLPYLFVSHDAVVKIVLLGAEMSC